MTLEGIERSLAAVEEAREQLEKDGFAKHIFSLALSMSCSALSSSPLTLCGFGCGMV